MCAKCRVQNCDHLGYYADSNGNSLKAVISICQNGAVLFYFMAEA
jgi:hypothetical protein